LCFNKLFKLKISNDLIIPGFYAVTLLLCVTALLGSIFIENVILIEPCILCILQRLCFILILISSFIMLITNYFLLTHKALVNKFLLRFLLDLTGTVSINLFALLGMLIAARQSWLQIYNSSIISSCGSGLKALLREYNIFQIISMAIQGDLACSSIGMRILGLSLANWGLILFTMICLLGIIVIFKLHKQIFRII
jgi:disulfide bond formation protein DsbB